MILIYSPQSFLFQFPKTKNLIRLMTLVRFLKYHTYVLDDLLIKPISSAVGGKTWGLVWEWGIRAAVVATAPSTSLASPSSSALPGGLALLGTNPVSRLVDFAVVGITILKSGSIFLVVITPPVLGVGNFLTVSGVKLGGASGGHECGQVDRCKLHFY